MESDARFAHLLQPIRDLAKNWEVDIASHLEDYVTEMEAIVISFDGGSTTMNFAEAALLIQGSACIYSKKVEYLYALVYQTLDLLASKKKMQQACSVDPEGKDQDASFAYQKNEIEFLSLDDLPVAKNIDLKGENDRNHNITGHLLAQTPLSLLKVEGADRGIPLTNRKGETVGYKADFRINSSMFHSSRALLIDPSHLSLLEQSLMRHPSSTPANFLLKAPCSPEKNDNVLPEIPDDMDDDDVPKLDMSADDIEMGMPFDDSFGEQQQPMQVEEKRALRARVIAPIKPIKEFVDPWQPLDPHDSKGVVLKPYKKGKSYKLPASMSKNAGKGRKRKKQPVPEKKELCPISEFINKAYFSHASKLPSNPLKLPYHPEFEYLYYTEYKKQLDTSRREKKRLAQQGKFEELAEREMQEAQEAEDYHGNLGGDAIPGMEDDGGDNFGFDGPEDVEDEVFPEDRLGGGQVDEMVNSQDAIVTSYEELVRKHVEAYLASASEYAQMTELSKRVQQWEDRITPVLAREEKFAYFDINEYGKFVLDRLDKVQKESEKEKATTFAKVMEDRQIHEVSRYFLATLQLANNYNVEVTSKGPGEEGMDSMALKLLNMKQHHENMAEYRAPSVDDNMQ